jgi:hypothetical protein
MYQNQGYQLKLKKLYMITFKNENIKLKKKECDAGLA